MRVKMIQDLGKGMEAKIEKMQEMFTKDPEELKNKQTGMNNAPERINRISEPEKQINDLEDRTLEITAIEQNVERRTKRNEDSLRDLWDNITHTNILITGIPEGKERKGPEKIFEEIKAENFPNMGKEIVKSRKHGVSQEG